MCLFSWINIQCVIFFQSITGHFVGSEDQANVSCSLENNRFILCDRLCDGAVPLKVRSHWIYFMAFSVLLIEQSSNNFQFVNPVNPGNLFVDQTHCLTLEGVVLPHQIPVSLRGSLPASRYPQPWGRRGRGCAAAVRRSEAVADASCLQPPDLPQCLGSARWVSFCTHPNDSWDYHSLI